MPRQIAMYLCKTLTHASLPEIGRSFGGKHHSTVIHSIRKVETLRKKDRDFNSVINMLIDSVPLSMPASAAGRGLGFPQLANRRPAVDGLWTARRLDRRGARSARHSPAGCQQVLARASHSQNKLLEPHFVLFNSRSFQYNFLISLFLLSSR